MAEHRPCPKCKKGEPVRKDCGYTSFNPVWCECSNDRCDWRVEGTYRYWNEAADAINRKGRISKSRQSWGITVARLFSEEQLLNLVRTGSLDGKKTRWG